MNYIEYATSTLVVYDGLNLFDIQVFIHYLSEKLMPKYAVISFTISQYHPLLLSVVPQKNDEFRYERESA